MKSYQVTQYGPASRTIAVEAENEQGVHEAIRQALRAGEEWDMDFDDIEHEDVEEQYK